MTRSGVTRRGVLGYRTRVQELDLEPAAERTVTSPAVLDLGVQDSGTGGALWALANRGVDIRQDRWPDELALVWSVRGAPHAYRRSDLPDVEAALRPYSPADAARRILDASRPLAAAGIPADTALAAVAGHLRDIVTEPLVKGEVSGRLSRAVTEPYLRWCRSCAATHVYELPFRLGALHAGVELEPGTSPPVLRRVPDWPADHLGSVAHDLSYPPRLDPVRGYLHLLGPARPADVAAYLDAPVRDVVARWPPDAIEVDVEGERRWVLAADADALGTAQDDADRRGTSTVRLLGPFDLFLQARDRATLVPDATLRAALWPALGRPGAVLVGGEVAGTWRPGGSGGTLRVRVERTAAWDDDAEAQVDREARRLAEHRGAALVGVDHGSVATGRASSAPPAPGVRPRRPPA